VDGFQVAADLRRSDPAQFYLLARQPVRYRFQDAESDISSETTVIGLDARGEVAAVRLNNRSLAPLRLAPDQVEPYYDAYRTFARMLESPEYRIQFKLEPGDLFIVDNLRVLHGRTGFSGAGSRHLQGCYADMDGLRSRLAVLERQYPRGTADEHR
jgi:gamma-butyrobetaine dioxygenase